MLRLESFHISPVTGFLPQQPNPVQPTTNPLWHQLAHNLPKVLPTGHFKARLQELPPFELTSTDPLDLEADMRSLSYLGHAWLWGDRQNIPGVVPAHLAKPWAAVAEKLGRAPILSYPSYCLYNWTRPHPEQPPHLGNIAIIQNFLGGLDEDWFILIHVDIEARAARALAAFPVLLAQPGDEQALTALQDVLAALRGMNATMKRMPEGCDPYIYYTRVRPYIFGTKNNPDLPDGLVYDGCFGNQPQFYRGETGAQSGIVPSLDALLGVAHANDPLKEYLLEMRLYMPERHRAFLEHVEATSQLRQQVQNSPLDELKHTYNHCLDELYAFRALHLQYAADYIHKQSLQTANSNVVGTGGTPFMTYLAKHRDETRVPV